MNQELLNALKAARGGGGSSKLHAVSLRPVVRPIQSAAAAAAVAVSNAETRNTKDGEENMYGDADAQTYNEKDAMRYFFDSGMDAWVDKCPEQVTIPTYIVSVSRNDARALLSKMDNQKKLLSSPSDDTDDSPIKMLEERLDQCMKEHDLDKDGCFVKLTTRSPKDSTVALARAKKAFQAVRRRSQEREFGTGSEKAHRHEESQTADHSDLWAAFGEQLRQALKVKSGSDALELLLSSERVREDLTFALEGDETETCWKIALAVRRWDDRCRPDREFRAFVWNGTLTCVGQYFSSVRFERLARGGDDDEKHQRAVLQRIERDARAVHEMVQPHVPLPCYSMDLVLSSEYDDDDDDTQAMEACRSFVVEINPLDGVGLGTQKASTGLFDWDKDRDVMTGRKPFEVRVRREPLTMEELKRKRPMLNRDWWDAIYGPIPPANA